MNATRIVRRLLVVLALSITASCGSAGPPESVPSQDPVGTSPAEPDRPVDYTVLVDAPSPEEPSLGFLQYFPAVLTVHPGDTIVFENEASVVAHTVTFGVSLDRSNQPVVPDGVVSPKEAVIALTPCRLPEPSTADLLECPEEGTLKAAWQLPDYDGTGFWNSGFLGSELEVTLDPSIAPGSYPFVCYLHPPAMNGILQVVPPDQPADEPADVLAEGRTAQSAALARGDADVPDPEMGEPGPEEVTIAAGWGTELVLVNEFSPVTTTVPAGTRITFTVFKYGHKVQTESPEFSSGELDAGESFSVVIDEPGVYPYFCIHHEGMDGVIVVT